MSNTIRTPKILNIAAGTVTAQTMNFAPEYDPNSQRLLVINMNASDSIAINAVGVYVDPQTGAETTVSGLIETFTGATSFAHTLNGPLQRITVTKTGTNGAATVIVNG